MTLKVAKPVQGQRGQRPRESSGLGLPSAGPSLVGCETRRSTDEQQDSPLVGGTNAVSASSSHGKSVSMAVPRGSPHVSQGRGSGDDIFVSHPPAPDICSPVQQAAQSGCLHATQGRGSGDDVFTAHPPAPDIATSSVLRVSSAEPQCRADVPSEAQTEQRVGCRTATAEFQPSRLPRWMQIRIARFLYGGQARWLFPCSRCDYENHAPLGQIGPEDCHWCGRLASTHQEPNCENGGYPGFDYPPPGCALSRDPVIRRAYEVNGCQCTWGYSNPAGFVRTCSFWCTAELVARYALERPYEFVQYVDAMCWPTHFTRIILAPGRGGLEQLPELLQGYLLQAETADDFYIAMEEEDQVEQEREADNEDELETGERWCDQHEGYDDCHMWWYSEYEMLWFHRGEDGDWYPDLTRDGDVEPNPGPVSFEEALNSNLPSNNLVAIAARCLYTDEFELVKRWCATRHWSRSNIRRVMYTNKSRCLSTFFPPEARRQAGEFLPHTCHCQELLVIEFRGHRVLQPQVGCYLLDALIIPPGSTPEYVHAQGVVYSAFARLQGLAKGKAVSGKVQWSDDVPASYRRALGEPIVLYANANHNCFTRCCTFLGIPNFPGLTDLPRGAEEGVSVEEVIAACSLAQQLGTQYPSVLLPPAVQGHPPVELFVGNAGVLLLLPGERCHWVCGSRVVAQLPPVDPGQYGLTVDLWEEAAMDEDGFSVAPCEQPASVETATSSNSGTAAVPAPRQASCLQPAPPVSTTPFLDLLVRASLHHIFDGDIAVDSLLRRIAHPIVDFGSMLLWRYRQAHQEYIEWVEHAHSVAMAAMPTARRVYEQHSFRSYGSVRTRKRVSVPAGDSDCVRIGLWQPRELLIAGIMDNETGIAVQRDQQGPRDRLQLTSGRVRPTWTRSDMIDHDAITRRVDRQQATTSSAVPRFVHGPVMLEDRVRKWYQWAWSERPGAAFQELQLEEATRRRTIFIECQAAMDEFEQLYTGKQNIVQEIPSTYGRLPGPDAVRGLASSGPIGPFRSDRTLYPVKRGDARGVQYTETLFKSFTTKDWREIDKLYIYAADPAVYPVDEKGCMFDMPVRIGAGTDIKTNTSRQLGDTPDGIVYIKTTRQVFKLVPWFKVHAKSHDVHYAVYKLVRCYSEPGMWRMVRGEKFLCTERIDVRATQYTTGPGGVKTQALGVYAAFAATVPEDAVGIVHQARNHHAAEDYAEEIDPVVNARMAVNSYYSTKRFAATIGKVKGWGAPRQHGKCCQSCGRLQPKRFRWRNRLCDICRPQGRLQQNVFESAIQLAEGYEVPMCYPGQVVLDGRENPFPEAKLATITIKPGQVQRRQGGKWVDMVAADLEKLHFDEPRPEVSLRLSGMAVAGATPMVSARSDRNAAKALLGRAFQRAPVSPQKGIWTKLVPGLLHLLLPEGLNSERMSDDEWLASMPADRRRPLTRAMEEYRTGGLQKRHATFRAFVKREKLPNFTKRRHQGHPYLTAGCSMVDRLIQGPHDVTHCVAGPWLKPCLAALKRQWTCSSPIFYASTGPAEMQKWLSGCSGSAFWSDFSMFDNTHSDASWNFVESLYQRFVDDDDFWRVMKDWRAPRGFIRGIRYRANVMNASGRDDTALANGLLNGIATSLSVAAALAGCSVMSLTPPAVQQALAVMKLAVCGDDSLYFLPPAYNNDKFKEVVKENIAAFGFYAKSVESSDHMVKAVFLGCRPVRVSGEWTWTKTTGRALYKLGWELEPKGDGAAWFTGVAEAVEITCRNNPILHSIAKRTLQLRAGLPRTPYRPEEPGRGMTDFYASGHTTALWDAQSIQDFCDAYSTEDWLVTPRDVQGCLDQIAGVHTLPVVLDHPLLKWCVWLDDL